MINVKSDMEYIISTGHTIADDGTIPISIKAELVRCRNCKYFSGSDDKKDEATAIGNCRNESVCKFPCNANFFCADGKRKE